MLMQARRPQRLAVIEKAGVGGAVPVNTVPTPNAARGPNCVSQEDE
jgi:hypothetical protein